MRSRFCQKSSSNTLHTSLDADKEVGNWWFAVARANDRRKRRIIPLPEQNLRAWAENRRTVNTHISQECLSLAHRPPPLPLPPLFAWSIIMRAARSSSHGHKELLHLRGLLHERRGSTALSHAIVQKWTPNNWRQASARAGNHRELPRDASLLEKYSRYFLDNRANQKVPSTWKIALPLDEDI